MCNNKNLILQISECHIHVCIFCLAPLDYAFIQVNTTSNSINLQKLLPENKLLGLYVTFLFCFYTILRRKSLVSTDTVCNNFVRQS